MDSTHAVLKVQRPHREFDHKVAAMAYWKGDGAMRLFDADPDRHALLLECLPGTPRSET